MNSESILKYFISRVNRVLKIQKIKIALGCGIAPTIAIENIKLSTQTKLVGVCKSFGA